jgi:hypothetical protein
MITDKGAFGEIQSENLNIGDMVEWTRWDEIEKKWTSNYGILIKIENKLKSNRIVSISIVKPINELHHMVELFTISLQPITKILGA